MLDINHILHYIYFQLLTRFHEEEYTTLSSEDLNKKRAHSLKDFKPSLQQIENLQRMTRHQSESPLWHCHREGRITATTAHDIKTMQQTTSPEGLLKKIMGQKYRIPDISKVPVINFSITHESKAKHMYFDAMKSMHENFTLRESGLLIDKACPIFAASPDGVRTCTNIVTE